MCVWERVKITVICISSGLEINGSLCVWRWEAGLYSLGLESSLPSCALTNLTLIWVPSTGLAVTVFMCVCMLGRLCCAYLILMRLPLFCERTSLCGRKSFRFYLIWWKCFASPAWVAGQWVAKMLGPVSKKSRLGQSIWMIKNITSYMMDGKKSHANWRRREMLNLEERRRGKRWEERQDEVKSDKRWKIRRGKKG